jgi:hypothetical protein
MSRLICSAAEGCSAREVDVSSVGEMTGIDEPLAEAGVAMKTARASADQRAWGPRIRAIGVLMDFPYARRSCGLGAEHRIAWG